MDRTTVGEGVQLKKCQKLLDIDFLSVVIKGKIYGEEIFFTHHCPELQEELKELHDFSEED